MTPTCLDCHTPLTRRPRGRPPKRCPACAAAAIKSRQEARWRYRSPDVDAADIPGDNMTPTCADCGVELPVSEGKRRRYRCIPCVKARNRAYAKDYYYKNGLGAKRQAAVDAAKLLPPPPPPVVETVEIIDDQAVRKLAAAVVLTAVREARAHKPEAVLWLLSKDAEMFYDVLDIHYAVVARWVKNGMSTKHLERMRI